jgi:hypothetical protein
MGKLSFRGYPASADVGAVVGEPGYRQQEKIEVAASRRVRLSARRCPGAS